MDSDNVVVVVVANDTGNDEKSETPKNNDMNNGSDNENKIESSTNELIEEEKCASLKEKSDNVVAGSANKTDAPTNDDMFDDSGDENKIETTTNDFIEEEKCDSSSNVENGWTVYESIEPAEVKMLNAYAAGKAKQHEMNKIKSIVRLFGAKGVTLPEICGTFEVLFKHPIDKMLLHEMIANDMFDEIPRTGRVFLQGPCTDYLDMRELANDFLTD